MNSANGIYYLPVALPKGLKRRFDDHEFYPRLRHVAALLG